MTQETLRQLAEAHYDRLFRAARFMSGDGAAAEDLVQETFLAAAQSLDRFEGRSSSYTWLYGILLNKFRRWLRRKGRTALSLQAMGDADEGSRADEVLEADLPGPVEIAQRNESAELVRAALADLTADHRSVLALRFVDGLSYEEIADVMDCPVGTVKSRIHYALQKVGDLLPSGQALG